MGFFSRFTEPEENIIVRHSSYEDDWGKGYFGVFIWYKRYGKMIGELKGQQENTDLMIGDIFVEPKFRNQGVGTKIMQVLFDKCSEYGITHIYGNLSECDDLEKNKVFYTGLGFIVEENKEREKGSPMVATVHKYFNERK